MSGNIIVKRHKQRRSRPKSSGAWKVAFADFTLAMMAFFMVLWILAVSNVEERKQFSENLRTYSVFDGENNPFDLSNSPHPVDFGQDFSVLDSKNRLDPEAIRKSHKTARSLNQRTADEEGENGYSDKPQLTSRLKGRLNTVEELALLAAEMEAVADAVGADKNIAVEIVPQGLRIIIKDNDNTSMFKRGSPQMTYFFQDVLRSLAPVFTRIDNRLMISGHTDAAQFHNAAFTNWELSSQRALQARQMLEIGGMPKNRVAQVVAMSDTALLDPLKPKSSSNRRIELLLLTEKAEAELTELFGQQPNNEMEKAVTKAKANNPMMRSAVMLEQMTD
ncbi:flagellar motor protein MotB [Thalassotalea sp. PLHSN55]|uniref:flagellar motor protein MotB n=1 Tax=Thalassotalea sp. PLHSN55 TaxID=3435888 RepID=UPI003F87B21F